MNKTTTQDTVNHPGHYLDGGIENVTAVRFWFGLSENQKREVLGRDGSDVSGLTNDEFDKEFLKNWGIEDDD